MIYCPKFKDHLRAEVVAPDRLLLLYECGHIEIQGRIFAAIAPLLDGRRTFPEILDEVRNEASVLDVTYALSCLQEQGHITESMETEQTSFSPFRDRLGVGAEDFSGRLKNTRICVHSVGSVSSQDFITALRSLNVRTEDNGDYWVALTDDYLQADLFDLSNKAGQLKRPLMLVKPVGTVLWIGPVLMAERTPCFECLAKRLAQNLNPASAPLCQLPTTFHTGLNMAATQVFIWVATGEAAHLQDRILTFDTLSMETRAHVFREHPLCSRCGVSPRPSVVRPLLLQRRRKKFTWEGGHRAVAPEETLEKFIDHVSPITGILSKLQPSKVHSAGVNQVFLTDWPSSRTRSVGGGFSLRNRCAGKGVTRLQAQVSALCEALERYSGIFQGNEVKRTTSFAMLRAEAIHPNACMNFSEQQFACRVEWNATQPAALHVPESFDENAEIEWTPLWSLTQGTFKYLPTAYCYFGYPLTRGRAFCGADSNGNAAGNTLEEAVLQGFMELVERDCATIWWYNQVRRPSVALDTFDQPCFRTLMDYYAGSDRKLWVLDITNDLGIPAFVAVSRRNGGGDREILGFGAHFSAELAILRALTELNQFLLNDAEIAAKKPDSTPAANLSDDTWLTPYEEVPSRVRADFPDISSDDLYEDVVRCVAIAKERGLETLVLDQTRPEVSLPVVKVVVPGLRSWWARFGSGRLYEVPVTLGWRQNALLEDELNSRHILF